MKIKCNRIKYTSVDFLYIVVVILGFVNLGKILMLIKYFQVFAGSIFQTDYFCLQNFESCFHTVNTPEIEYQLCICKALSL